ncbi:MAG: flavodoxin family protein, partial [Lachnospiraceae bacterium]|nr:flavodoxin family protein [Lachnospiraceae bacterium]
LSGKYATQITTSKHFYDVTAHEFIRENCKDLGLRYLPGFSADMEDLLHKKGQREAAAFFRHLLWSIKLDAEEEKQGAALAEKENAGVAPAEKEGAKADAGKRVRKQQIVVVADIEEGDEALAGLVQAFQEGASQEVRVVNLQEFPFAGGCLGCFHCAADGTCIYKDHFDEFLREKIQTADACVYAFTIKDHSMGYRFKLFDDRQFCNGHRTVTMGKPVGYLICGELDKEPNLRMVIEARAQVGGNYLTGIVTQDGKKSGEELSRETERLSKELGYCIRRRFNQPANFYGVGGMKIFRDLIWQMQGMMREDHRFYKEHGFYDFPQKKVGTILGMYLVGFMLNNEKLRSKIGGNMTKGMLLPYQNAIEKAKK